MMEALSADRWQLLLLLLDVLHNKYELLLCYLSVMIWVEFEDQFVDC